MNPIRIGYGYDTHRLTEGRKLILGGVEIAHYKGLLGHSDADVLLHAICDAMLGALNLRDIGFHFPDTDPRYKNADSRIFLEDAYRLVKEKGYVLGNLDCTVIAEKPKINPHVPAMQQIIAEILETETENISIKATTNEKMDAPGKEESMIAHAVVLLFARMED
ncbi:MAG: 2-C-methyl-D-erythritol 2,4-cyclodiphosphate synthase [Bacteroidia bacterium]|nr:2-C-methyl-D-erythritol 2,4-cyclodiphosphate synthase [Bacteroidia bacterium]